MKAVITRDMVVANAKGEAEQFRKGDKPVEVDVDTYRRLNRAGAAVAASDDNTADNTETHGVAGGRGDEGPRDESGVDLNGMTKDELADYAKENGYTVDASKKKADIIADIRAQMPTA